MDLETIKTYNTMAREYDLETIDFWEQFPRNIIQEFQTQIKSGLVLDLGSGPGRDGMLLQKTGLNVVCLDASSSMVHLTTQKGLPSVQADFVNIPFNENIFNGVWAYTSLLHVPRSDISLVLQEIRRVMTKESVLGIGIIEGRSEGYKFSSGVDKPRLFAYYEKGEMENLLINNGFKPSYFHQFQPKSRNYLNFLARKI